MKNLDWDKVVSKLFYAMITILFGIGVHTLRNLAQNVSDLNVKMAVVVEQLDQNAQITRDQKMIVEEHGKTLIDHEKRITVLEVERQ